MSTSSIVTVFIFLNFLTYFTVCNRDPLLAFTGCNATLQWDLSNSSYEQKRTHIRIIDNAGDVIAQTENNQCMIKTHLSMSCILSHKNDDLILSLKLFKITTNHTGNYTARFRKDLHLENKITPLIVIDKPQIMEDRKPVLYQSFLLMCTTSYKSECIIYYWKINGSDLQYSINLYATRSTLTYRNVTMMDNFSTLTCRAGIEKCNNSHCNSSEDSDPYTFELYFSAIDSGKDKTVSPIDSGKHKTEHSIFFLGVGLVIVAVCLIIVGALTFVMHRRKYDSTRLVSLAVSHPCAGPTNREITQDFLPFQKEDRPLPIPAVPVTSYRIQRRSFYPNINRKSISLHSFVNHDQALWRPVRHSLSLQSLIQLSHEIGRRGNSDDSLCKPFRSKKGRQFSIDGSETGIRAEELYSKVKIHKNVGYNEQNPDAISPSMINVRPQSFAQEQQELYSAIDETSWMEYDYARANMQVENLQDNQRNTDAGHYDYDYAFLPPTVTDSDGKGKH